MRDWPIPAGFTACSEGRSTLIALDSCLEALRAAGLHRPEAWQELLGAATGRPGRGATAVLELPSGTRARLKQMRRGGWVGSLWHDRFVGTRRLLDNLSIPRAAVLRGIRTPAPLALLMLAGGGGLYRGWLALEDCPGAVDLASCFAAGQPPSREELRIVMDAVRRMHDLGLEHRDLNLGNLLLVGRPTAAPEALVVDLDRARLHPGGLPFRLRQHAIRRIERSHAKAQVATPDAGRIRDLYYSLYAAGDRELGDRLARGRDVGRFWIRVHRLGWRR